MIDAEHARRLLRPDAALGEGVHAAARDGEYHAQPRELHDDVFGEPVGDATRCWSVPRLADIVARSAPDSHLKPRRSVGCAMIYADITQTIGRTPVVRINHLAPAHVTMYVKLEAANPGGSVKDRLALGIVEDAERRGLLKPGATVVEATSGNTGIALALVCASRGYAFVAVMPESFSVERRLIMRAYGAKVVLTA